MKRFFTLIISLCLYLSGQAQGWPEGYGGVMLQGFSWDSFVDTQWANLESQADELAQYFSLIWVPQSGNCNSTYNQMGYTPYYWFDHNSSFGSEEQLRSMIKTFSDRGLGTIADVVINHRNTSGWVGYPAETYNGVTYQLQSTDICANDDNGKTKAWADQNGYRLGNNDSGEDWDGCRDLDHLSPNVQSNVKAYLHFLLDDLGYTGFRYDMVKGFGASYIGSYNADAKPQFSVGEHWSSNSDIKNWMQGTMVDGTIQSGAFDFQFRYAVRDAINQRNWTKLANAALISEPAYRRYAVTFVENHDMQDRGNVTDYTKDPIVRDTLAANAFLLAMPGTPCVFLPHWKACKQELKAMIDARHAAGITNTSTYVNISNRSRVFGNAITGTKGRLMVVVGAVDELTMPAIDEWREILRGTNYAYYLSNDTETAWADKASGTYDEAFDVTITAVSAAADARLVYTTDGSEPTAASTQADGRTTLHIDATTTLKVGLLTGGVVKGVISRNYVVQPFQPHKATVYLKNPGWGNVYFYAWDSNGELLGKWPGTPMTATVDIDGNSWYYREFDVNAKDYTFNIIFNQGSGQMQTVDIGPINSDKYYEIAGTNNGKYTVNDLTGTVTGIEKLRFMRSDERWQGDTGVYDLQGRKVADMTEQDAACGARTLKPGIYICRGKKLVVR